MGRRHRADESDVAERKCDMRAFRQVSGRLMTERANQKIGRLVGYDRVHVMRRCQGGVVENASCCRKNQAVARTKSVNAELWE